MENTISSVVDGGDGPADGVGRAADGESLPLVHAVC